ncbi:MAG: universal stress protein [Gammaproteobacteria bacterium 39-13]|nr:MAG: universal stress protein [Gammaproteobacteria bacterium 39-13]
MQRFNNILFVSHGVGDKKNALKQALSIARNNKAILTALIIYPELPKELINYREQFEMMLKEQLQKSIQVSREEINLSEEELQVKIEIENGKAPAVRIVKHVLKSGYDLVVKDAESENQDKGFKSVDIELLSKCPCPVWLCRPISEHRNKIKVAVAIDPKDIPPEGYDLSLLLLRISRSLADTCNGELGIISCWDYELEHFLRNNIWSQITEDEITKILMSVETEHRAALDGMIRESNINGKNGIYHIRGQADVIIPQFVVDEKIDILVMGTVARTGISGFIFGNTAEDILRKLRCSVLAIKPNGFVSPIKAY